MTPEINALRAGLDAVHRALFSPAHAERRKTAMRRPGEHKFTAFDDPDRQMVTIEGIVSYYYTEGEEMVRYYPDGSGYPGSPPEVEFFDPIVVSVHLCLGDHEFDVPLIHNTEQDLKDMGEAAWGLVDEDKETEAVIAYEEDMARDGPEE
jgi:hypothetical protein